MLYNEGECHQLIKQSLHDSTTADPAVKAPESVDKVLR